MAQVVWTAPALSELFNIGTNIAHYSEVRAEKFIAGAFDKTDLLVKHPQIGQKFAQDRKTNLRQLIYGDYIIIYRVIEESVQIVALVHGRRNLNALKDKIQDNII